MEKNSSVWRKSTYSGGTGGNCVEVGRGDGRVLVRDTRSPEAFTLSVPPRSWQTFTRSLRK
jgi:hypothetical protein